MGRYEKREVGSPSRALDDRDDEAGLPSGRNHSEAQNEDEEGKQKDATMGKRL